MVEVSEGEIEGALALTESMTREDLQGEEFRDAYTEAIAKIIESKREDKLLPEAPEPKEEGQVLDLMAALQESVRKAQASRRETADSDADVHDLEQLVAVGAGDQAGEFGEQRGVREDRWHQEAGGRRGRGSARGGRPGRGRARRRCRSGRSRRLAG
ncbi:hypothetical protein [Streptomyces sp. NPDC005476]|uniref:hypothetical protein n=1 Tax=Streptomyces sp. NPDC005476 TaxID=3156882 RepID=UPI003455D273